MYTPNTNLDRNNFLVKKNFGTFNGYFHRPIEMVHVG